MSLTKCKEGRESLFVGVAEGVDFSLRARNLERRSCCRFISDRSLFVGLIDDVVINLTVKAALLTVVVPHASGLNAGDGRRQPIRQLGPTCGAVPAFGRSPARQTDEPTWQTSITRWREVVRPVSAHRRIPASGDPSDGALVPDGALCSGVTRPHAISSCAVTATLCSPSTLAAQPRVSWEARNLASTTNSNAPNPSGRGITNAPRVRSTRTRQAWNALNTGFGEGSGGIA